MRIKISVETYDVVKRAERAGKQLDYKVAERALVEFRPTIERALEDAKAGLVTNVMDYALLGEKFKNVQS